MNFHAHGWKSSRQSEWLTADMEPESIEDYYDRVAAATRS